MHAAWSVKRIMQSIPHAGYGSVCGMDDHEDRVIVSEAMRVLAARRWAKTSPQERSEAQRQRALKGWSAGTRPRATKPRKRKAEP